MWLENQEDRRWRLGCDFWSINLLLFIKIYIYIPNLFLESKAELLCLCTNLLNEVGSVA